MVVWISQELPCSISRVSIYYARDQTSEWNVIGIWISRDLLLFNFERVNISWCRSYIRVKIYDRLNLLRAFVFNFEGLDISWASIIQSSQKLWLFEFAESFLIQCRGSRYMMHVNRTSEWKDIAIWISRELPFLNFERLDISWASIIHTSQKLWPFEFAESFRVQFRGSRYMMHVNRTSEWNVIAIWISRELLLFNFERLDI